MCGTVFSVLNSLRQLREEEGLSRASLARAAGLSDRTVKRIEDEDGYLPTTVTKHKIRNGLNRTASSGREYELDDLFDEREE